MNNLSILRQTLLGSALLVCGVLINCSSPANRAPAITLGETKITGLYPEKDTQVAAFLGLPYAQAERWRAPIEQPLAKGAINAQTFGPACMQTDYNADWYADVAAAFGFQGRPVRTPAVSEDCLFLNIWTPTLKPAQAKPVMVWIHGGSNKAGWSQEPNYLGHKLAAQEDVVVVSINYRLGLFGFFDYPNRASDDRATHFALLDQIAALEWIQHHIAAFGGDPANVTLFGESAGAADIGYLITSPVAGHLFQRAISQSGGFQLRNWEGQGTLRERGSLLAEQLGDSSQSLDTLRALPAEQLLQHQQAVLSGFDLRAEPGQPELPYSSGDFFRNQVSQVDLLIATNANEWYMYNQDHPEAVERDLASLPETLHQPLRERLAGLDNRHAQDQLSTLTEMTCAGYFMAASTAKAGKQAWVYRFDRVREGPGGDALLAYHGAEIPYVFNTHDHWLETREADLKVTAAMMRYWANFARTGNPNDPSLPNWPSFTALAPAIMLLQETPSASPAPDAALCAQMDTLLWH